MHKITRTQFALLLHTVPHLGPKGISRLLHQLPDGLPDSEIDLDELSIWRVSADTLERDDKLHPDAARCLTSEKDHLLKSSKEILDCVRTLGISVITCLDGDYPLLLKEYGPDPPPIVYAHGNLGLLRDRKFAVVSSSDLSLQSAEVIREYTGTLSDEGLALVTSHNTHAYQVSGLAARARNASVILVLDRGILSAFPNGLGFEPIAQARIWELKFDPKKDLVISRFRLYDPWIGSNGRERDKMVFGLSDIVIAVEVRPGGVMENECSYAHRKGREVYVYAPDEIDLPAGNRDLLEKGCSPIPAPTAHSLLTTLDLLSEPVEPLFVDEF